MRFKLKKSNTKKKSISEAVIIQEYRVLRVICGISSTVPSLVFFFSLELHINFVLLYTQVTELPFFASKVRLGRCGIDQVYGLGPLNER